MSTIRMLFNTLGQMASHTFNLCGYSVSFGVMFAFACILSICGYILVKILF